VSSKINERVHATALVPNLDAFADRIRANSSRPCMAIQGAGMAARIDGYLRWRCYTNEAEPDFARPQP
jgi:hypothetical protein